jgi:biopolymer transport protein ExbD
VTSLTDSPLSAPRSAKKYGISLTPLADAMFNLLLFFMLTSNVTPYALLTLKAASGVPGATTGEGPGPAAGALVAPALITVEEGALVLNGQRFPLDRARDLAGALTLQGTRGVVLIVTPDAQVQDLTAVLEQLAVNDIREVQIARGGAAP